MAERRMFAKTIIDSDAFLEMPLSTQALYFHLSMRADDDGFLNNAKKIMRMVGANQNDYDLLVAKSFIIQFDDGICVIKHWRINNYLRNDRYKPTIYAEQRDMLEVKENGRYSLKKDDGIPLGIPMVDRCETQYSIGKDSIVKDSIGKDNIPPIYPPLESGDTTTEVKKDKPVKHKYGEYQHVLLTDDEYNRLCDDFTFLTANDAIKYLDEYIEMKGYKAKNHNLCIRKWVLDALKRNGRYNSGNKAEQQLNETKDALSGFLGQGE